MKDDSIFLSAMKGVTPLKKNKSDSQFISKQHVSDKSAKKFAAMGLEFDDGNVLTTEPVDIVDKDEVLAYKKDGVQDGVYKNLRLGKYEIDSTLNLHGHSVKEASNKLFEFLIECRRINLRSIHILHGKGLVSKQAILKSYINHWLRNLDFVLAFHSAQTHHGGSGAVYVLLKKNDVARAQNRERHQKRQT